ncbi:MAG: hypothetical protein J1F23_08520 [Oscillospiraceae bacterium]|nr:hypothetical protein [Oscillospiraceae bacterium]
MKKNKMMRIASVLLVAVLLTTSVISGTFAKYVTTGEASDSARVAKFGVVVAASGSLFDKTYFAVNDGNTPAGNTADDPETKITVESYNGRDNLVAPGTKSLDGGLSIAVTGKPEVDVRVTLDFEAIEDVFLATKEALPDMTTGDTKDTFDNEEDYYPLVFTLKGEYLKDKDLTAVIDLDTTKQASDGIVSGTLAQIKAVFDVLNGDDGIYVDANTRLAEAIGTFTLTWEWAFEDAAAAQLATLEAAVRDAEEALAAKDGQDDEAEQAALVEAQQNLATAQAAVKLLDQKDTLLGDLAAGTDLKPKTNLVDGTDYNLNVSVKLTVTVTQVD